MGRMYVALSREIKIKTQCRDMKIITFGNFLITQTIRLKLNMHQVLNENKEH